jgi:hypothetical protein
MSPGFPLGDHVTDALRLLTRQIMLFRAIAVDVVHFPLARWPLGHKLPLVDADSPVALVFPVDRVALDRLAIESRY